MLSMTASFSLLRSCGQLAHAQWTVQIPARIHFTWGSSGLSWSMAGRRLLDLEKITFVTDDNGEAPGLLLLSYTTVGVHRDGPDQGPSHLLYNIGAREQVASARQLYSRD
jgi:hypothetical protein